MAPDRASAKLSVLLKDRRSPLRGLLKAKPITRSTSPALLTQSSFQQVPLPSVCKPATTSSYNRACSNLFAINGTLHTHISAICPGVQPHVMHGYLYVQSSKGPCVDRLRPLSIDHPRPLGTRLVFRKCQLRYPGFILHTGLICTSRSLSAVASQDAETQHDSSFGLQELKMHSAGSQLANVPTNEVCVEPISEENNAESKEAGKKQGAYEEALKSLETLLDQMEASAGTGDQRLGVTCLRLAQLCDSADVEPARILSYGQRALKVYESVEVSWEHATCLHVIGHAHFKMGEYESTVVHLEQSASILNRLKATMSEQDINTLKHAGQTLLGQAKMSLGRHHEALPHFQKSMKLAEKLLEPGNPDLGVVYLQAAQAYKEAKDPDEAICLCIKALENHANYYGPSSSQAAGIRRLMAVVYFDLREFENSLSEYETVWPILEGLGKSEEVATLDLVAVESLLELEKYDEAISKLEGVINGIAETSPSHGNALVMLAKTYAIIKNNVHAAMYCKKALNVLGNQMSSIDTGSSLVNLALVYQRQQEIELATLTYKRALEIFNKISGYQANAAAADVEGQIGFLLLHVEKVDEALPFLERSVSKKKSIHGEASEELLDVHNHLGVAYSQEGKLDEALEQFEAAKSILSKNITEVDSLTISVYSNLANMYSVFGRLDEAVECQKVVIDSVKRNRDVETMVSLQEAEKTLEDLQREAKVHKSSPSKN